MVDGLADDGNRRPPLRWVALVGAVPVDALNQ